MAIQDRKSYQAEWYQKNKERILKQREKEYIEKREGILKYQQNYRSTHKEKISLRDKKYKEEKGEVLLEKKRAYYKTARGRFLIYQATKRFRGKYPHIYKVYCAVRRAIKSGKIVRGPCQECGASEAQAHHEDYSKPFEIKWLCQKCHSKLHAESNKIFFS